MNLVHNLSPKQCVLYRRMTAFFYGAVTSVRSPRKVLLFIINNGMNSIKSSQKIVYNVENKITGHWHLKRSRVQRYAVAATHTESYGIIRI